MVTISQNWTGTPYVLTVFLLMDLFILWQYRDFLRPLLEEGKNSDRIRVRTEKSWQGHLTWLAGWALQLISIPISYQNLPLAFVSSGLGVSLAILSFKVDKIFLRKLSANF